MSVMRTVVALALLCTVSAPCLAQELSPNFLKKEPYFLSPWSVVYVDNGSCGVGKVMKVTGALGALRRKKACVPMGREQASRAVAIP
ncbi:MAG: hypothetical protein ACJAVZ_002382 [Afipia broomeae]|jgi:hypothetical protein